MHSRGSAGSFPSKGCLQQGTCIVSFIPHNLETEHKAPSSLLTHVLQHIPSFVPFALHGTAMAGSIHMLLPLACWWRMHVPGERALAGRGGKQAGNLFCCFYHLSKAIFSSAQLRKSETCGKGASRISFAVQYLCLSPVPIFTECFAGPFPSHFSVSSVPLTVPSTLLSLAKLGKT